jgi:hypothetical protein
MPPLFSGWTDMPLYNLKKSPVKPFVASLYVVVIAPSSLHPMSIK